MDSSNTVHMSADEIRSLKERVKALDALEIRTFESCYEPKAPVPVATGSMNFMDYLDQIEDSVPDGAKRCPMCDEVYFRVLDDESKLGFVPGNFWGTFAIRKRLFLKPYQLRHAVVYCGAWSRNQLKESGISFTRHELDIAQRRYLENRPRRCGCFFGSASEKPEWLLNAIMSNLGPKAVDTTRVAEKFIISPMSVLRPRHLRSPEARKRRYKKRRITTLKVLIKPLLLDKFPSMRVDVCQELVLKFNYRPPRQIKPQKEERTIRGNRIATGRSGPYIRYYTLTEALAQRRNARKRRRYGVVSYPTQQWFKTHVVRKRT